MSTVAFVSRERPVERPKSIPEQPTLLVLHHAIALTAGDLEPRAIMNQDVPAALVDERCLSQGPEDEGDGWAMHTEQRRHELVSDRDVVADDQVADGEQPANTSLLDV